MSRTKLTTADIKVGAPMPFNAYDANGQLLLAQGHIIVSDAQIERLLNIGIYGEHDGTPNPDFQDPQQHNTSKVRVSAFELLHQIRDELAQTLAVASGNDDFASDVVKLAERILHAVELDSDAALATILLDCSGRSSIRQSVNTAIVTATILYHHPHADFQAQSGIAAALTMNVAMMDMHDLFYVQSTPLTPEQQSFVVNHPRQGTEQLRALGVTDELWLNIVLQHHEAFDGSGYPAKLIGEAITPFARVVSIADRFCGMVAERDYRPGAPPEQAMELLLQKHKGANEPDAVAQLVRELGHYPPGTVVALANQEIAIVVRHSLNSRHPIVRSIANLKGQKVEGFPKRLTSKQTFAVLKSLPRKLLGDNFDPTALWHDTVVNDDRDQSDMAKRGN